MESLLNFSNSIVGLDNDILTLTYDHSGEDEAENFENEVNKILEGYEIQIDSMNGDPEEEEWIIVNIQIANFSELSKKDLLFKIKRIDNL